MRRRRKKSSINVDPLDCDNVDGLLSDSTWKERFQIFEVCASLHKYIAGLLTAAGSLSFFLSLQCFAGVQIFSIPQLGYLSLVAVVFIGIVNIICGLLLLATK